ncbi:hypothetical protein GL409_04690 [Salmonella enterica]|nr:hypothetical protein [Salmonella enterica]
MKKINIWLVLLASIVVSKAGIAADDRKSEAATGSMNHVINGSVPTPLVKWVDNPVGSAGGQLAKDQVFGTLEVTLGGSATATESRFLMIGGTCGKDGGDFVFKNTTDLINVGNTDGPSSFIAKVGTPPSEWKTFAGDYFGWNGTMWQKDGDSRGEQVDVNIVSKENRTGLTPGVYAATFCIQQIVG